MNGDSPAIVDDRIGIGQKALPEPTAPQQCVKVIGLSFEVKVEALLCIPQLVEIEIVLDEHFENGQRE